MMARPQLTPKWLSRHPRKPTPEPTRVGVTTSAWSFTWQMQPFLWENHGKIQGSAVL